MQAIQANVKPVPIGPYEHDYALLVQDILSNGVERQTRNAVTRSVFGRTLRVTPLANELPLLRGRQMFPRGVLGEMAAFLKGPKSIEDFKAQGCNFWGQWAKEDGSINVDYGNTWLNFEGVNQLEELVAGLKADPTGRRHIVTGWHPGHLKQLSLPCCHLLYQWYVNGDHLDMMWYQRSVDVMIGLPSDVVLAYAFNLAVANEVGLRPGALFMTLGDTHIYRQHFDGAQEYLARTLSAPVDPMIGPFHSPVSKGLWDFDPSAFDLGDTYQPLPRINFELIA